MPRRVKGGGASHNYDAMTPERLESEKRRLEVNIRSLEALLQRFEAVKERGSFDDDPQLKADLVMAGGYVVGPWGDHTEPKHFDGYLITHIRNKLHNLRSDLRQVHSGEMPERDFTAYTS